MISIVRETPALRVAVTPERSVIAKSQRRARCLLELEARRPAGGERHLVVALDRSSSMKGERLRDGVEALRALVRGAPDGVTLSAITFDAGIRHLFGKTRLDNKSRPLLLRRLEGLTHGLGTDHGAALLEGLRATNADGRGHLLLITDGYSSRGVTELDQLVSLVQHARGESTVSTLGIGELAEGWVLGALARTGGGVYQHALSTDGDSSPSFGPITAAVGAELGLLHHLFAPDVRVCFRVQPPVRLRKLYARGPAWREDDARVVRLPRLVHGEPLALSFELERETTSSTPDPWGMVEVFLTDNAGTERRVELPLRADVGAEASAPDPRVALTILKHRVGIAIIDACTTTNPARAAAWLHQRLSELRVVAEEHGLVDAGLSHAFEQAVELRETLYEKMSHQRKNRLSHLGELCVRGASPEPPSTNSDLKTRVTGLEMLLPCDD